MYFDIQEVLESLFVCFCLDVSENVVGLCSKYLRWHKPGRDGREKIKGFSLVLVVHQRGKGLTATALA